MSNSIRSFFLIFSVIFFFVIWGLYDIENSDRISKQITTYFSYITVIILLFNDPIKIFTGNRASFLFTLLLISYLFTTMINFNLVVGNINFFAIFLIPIGYFFWTSIFYFVQFLLIEKKYLINFHRYIKISGFLISLSVIVSYIFVSYTSITFGETAVSSGSYVRAFGPLGDNVGFICILFLLNSFEEKKYLWVLFHIVAVIVTGTKTAIFCGFLGLILLVIFNIRFATKKSISNIVFPIIVIFTILLALFQYNLLENATARLFDENDFEGSSFQRKTVIGLATLSFSESPIWGYGYSGFNKIAQKKGYENAFLTDNIEHDVSNAYYNTNNQILEVANNGGIISLIIFMLFIFSIFKNARRIIQNNNTKIPYLSYYIYIFVMVIFNQTAVYLLNGATSGFMFLIVSAFLVKTKNIILEEKI